MVRYGWGALLLLILGAAAWAADDAKEKPKAEKSATPAEEYQALQQEYQKAQNEIFGSLGSAKTDEDREKVFEKYQKLGPTFAKRFLDFADKHAKDPEAVDALGWIVTNAESAPEAEKAVNLLIKEHLNSAKVGNLIQMASRQTMLPPGEKLIRAVLEQSKDKDNQGRACYALAQLLKHHAELVDQIKGLEAKRLKQIEGMYGKDFLKTVGSRDQEKLQKESETLLEQVSDKYADVKLGNRTLGDVVKTELFELRHLAIGKEPPDIEGEDIDGKKFKLSDYRGKVVVIDFWGNW